MVENIHNFFSSLPSLFVSNDVDFLKHNRIIVLLYASWIAETIVIS